MLTIASKETVREYREAEGLNQSKAKKLITGITGFDFEEDSNKPHFIVGSAVDCLLLGEEGEFDATYYVSKAEKKPTDSILAIVNVVYGMCLEDYQEYLTTVINVIEPTVFNQDCVIIQQDSLEEAISIEQDSLEVEVPVTSFIDFTGSLMEKDTYILAAAEQTGFQSRWGAEAKLKAVKLPEVCVYFENMLMSYGRTVIDSVTYYQIIDIVRSLKTNFRTAHFFDRETLNSTNQLEVYYQLPVFFDYKSPTGYIVPCKGLLDMAVVVRNSENGQIQAVTGIDLKTMAGNTINFIDSLRQRRYDIQAAWYNMGLSQLFQITDPGVLKPFTFVVESSTNPGKPIVYQASDELIAIGTYGREAVQLVDTNLFDGQKKIPSRSIIKYPIKGIEQIMETYIFHQENGWNEERELHEAGALPLVLDWEGILKQD